MPCGSIRQGNTAGCQGWEEWAASPCPSRPPRPALPRSWLLLACHRVTFYTHPPALRPLCDHCAPATHLGARRLHNLRPLERLLLTQQLNHHGAAACGRWGRCGRCGRCGDGGDARSRAGGERRVACARPGSRAGSRQAGGARARASPCAPPPHPQKGVALTAAGRAPRCPAGWQSRPYAGASPRRWQ